LSIELIPVSWQSVRWWLSHKPGGRPPLLCTRRAVNFPSQRDHPGGRYQIILLGDRHTMTQG